MPLEAIGPKHHVENTPHREVSTGKFSEWIPTAGDITANIKKIAIPAITLFVLSNIPGVEGGPMAYGLCAAACLSWATPIFMPACIMGCLPVLHAPTP
jgi:hypothetical protein